MDKTGFDAQNSVVMPEQLDKIAEALTLKKERRDVDFKRTFSPDAGSDWCELLKDVMAIANSGGGVIVFGLNDDGSPAGVDVSAIAKLDPAAITDKINAYVGVQYSDFRIVEAEKNGAQVVCWELDGADSPLIPSRPGTYAVPVGKGQLTAFGRGVLLVRHGAKSEPGTSADLNRILSQRIEAARKEILRGVRKIVRAPAGSKVEVSAPDSGPSRRRKRADAAALEDTQAVHVTASGGTPVRLTSNPEAPEMRVISPDQSHPHRMTELLRLVNGRNAGENISPATIHHIDAVNACFGNITYCLKTKHGPRTYSDAFAEWILNEIKKNPRFATQIRSQCRRLRQKSKSAAKWARLRGRNG